MVYFEKKNMVTERVIPPGVSYKNPEHPLALEEGDQRGVSERAMGRQGEGGGIDRNVVEVRNKVLREATGARSAERDALLTRVEHILSKGFAEKYAALSSDKKAAFRAEGESLALWLRDAVMRNAVKSHRLLPRIERWLRIIEQHKDPWILQEAYNHTRYILHEIRNDIEGF